MSFGSAPSAPTPASPQEQSQAQTQANEQTALYQYGLNNPTVNTPYGSQTYAVGNTSPTYDTEGYNKALQAWQTAQSSSGGTPSTMTRAQFDPDGSKGALAYQQYVQGQGGGTPGGESTPQPKLSDFQTGSGGNPSVTENLSFSPTQQALYDQSTANQTQQGQIAGTALQGVSDQFNTPYDLSGAVGGMTPSQTDLMGDYGNQYKNLMQQQTAYLDPQYGNEQKQLDAKLANQGIMPGSEAYNNAQEEQGRNKTFAYQQAANQAQVGAGSEQTRLANLGLANQQQAAQLYTQQYQQPLNLYNSLETGTQASLPQFSPVSQTNQAPPNVLGAYANNYQGQLNNYNTQVGSQNSMLSGLGGIAGALGSAAIMLSDRRLKTAIKRLGNTMKKLSLYEFEYIGDDSKHIGVMADDVAKVMPDAVVIMENGFKAVDYAKIGVAYA